MAVAILKILQYRVLQYIFTTTKGVKKNQQNLLGGISYFFKGQTSRLLPWWYAITAALNTFTKVENIVPLSSATSVNHFDVWPLHKYVGLTLFMPFMKVIKLIYITMIETDEYK